MKRILFVDDESRVLDGLRRSLRPTRDEWELMFALSVDEALTILDESDMDAIVCDHNMPGKTGLVLLTLLRAGERHAHTPFIMLTGNSEAQLRRDALEAGANDFLSKPCDDVELVVRLRNILTLKEFHDQIIHQNEILEQRVRERTRDLERSQTDIVLRLAKAAEARDSDTGHHIIRVGIYSMLLSKALALPEAFQRQIMLTSPLHDVGKIGISDAILRKEGALTDEERAIMQRHCEIGAEILSEQLLTTFSLIAQADECSEFSNRLLHMAANIARHHHERWDGAGYPGGLQGEHIPIEARIVSVADVFDALRSERPYKHALSLEETMDAIRKGSGSQFDPQIVEALESIVDEFERVRIELADHGLEEKYVA